jgi:hypothetical protein
MGAGLSGPVQSKLGMDALRPLPRLVQYSQAAAADACLCADLCSGHANCSTQQFRGGTQRQDTQRQGEDAPVGASPLDKRPHRQRLTQLNQQVH